MIGEYEYKKLYHYPHLRLEEVNFYDQLIIEYPALFDSVDFDVKVGTGNFFRSILPKQVYEDGKILSKWRIDLIGYKDDLTTIVELKKSARAGAIGQLICYELLFRKTHTNVTNLELLLVTDQLVPDLLFCCNTLKIKTILL